MDTFEAHLQRLTLTPLEALKDPKTKAQRKKCLARVASALLGTIGHALRRLRLRVGYPESSQRCKEVGHMVGP